MPASVIETAQASVLLLPRKTERQSTEGFQKRSLVVQWCLFTATLAAFGAAAWYAHIATQQSVTMTETLKEAHIQNVAQQRAILTVDGNPISLRGGDIGLRIKDRGRLAAKIARVRMTYEQIRSNSPSLSREKEETVGVTVSPDEPFILSFTPPQIPRLSNGEKYYVRLDIDLFYDDGFGNSQHISPCLSYDIDAHEWSQSCMSTYRIDLSKDLPNDVWRPPQKKK